MRDGKVLEELLLEVSPSDTAGEVLFALIARASRQMHRNITPVVFKAPQLNDGEQLLMFLLGPVTGLLCDGWWRVPIVVYIRVIAEVFP